MTDTPEDKTITKTLARAIDPTAFPKDILAVKLDSDGLEKLLGRHGQATISANLALAAARAQGWLLTRIEDQEGKPIPVSMDPPKDLLEAMGMGIARGYEFSSNRDIRRCLHRAKAGCQSLGRMGYIFAREQARSAQSVTH
jgi:hypothetical protein